MKNNWIYLKKVQPGDEISFQELEHCPPCWLVCSSVFVNGEWFRMLLLNKDGIMDLEMHEKSQVALVHRA